MEPSGRERPGGSHETTTFLEVVSHSRVVFTTFGSAAAPHRSPTDAGRRRTM